MDPKEKKDTVEQAVISIYSIVLADGIKKDNVMMAAYEFLKKELQKNGDQDEDALKLNVGNREFKLTRDKLTISNQ